LLDGACPCEAEFDDQAVLEEGPLALDATLGLRRMGADELNPEFVGGTAELRDGGQTAQLLVKCRLAVDEECAVLVGVEAEGKAMREADLGEQVEIGPRVLDLDESGPAEVGRVVDGADEGEPGATAFEPVVGEASSCSMKPKAGLRSRRLRYFLDRRCRLGLCRPREAGCAASRGRCAASCVGIGVRAGGCH